MTTPVTLPLSFSLLLDEMINALLYKRVKNADGTVTEIERDIPFALKYAITKDLICLDKDAAAFKQQQMITLAKYGEPTEDGQTVVINDPEKVQLYKNEMEAILDTEVTHNVAKLDGAKLGEIIDDDGLNFSESALKVLLNYLVDDEPFRADLEMQIHFKDYVPPVKEQKSEPVKEEAKTEMDEVITPPEEVAATTPKKSTKKTSSKKSTTTKKTTKKKEA